MKITPNDPPRTLTAAEIEAILPHRSPFALVDKITDYTVASLIVNIVRN